MICPRCKKKMREQSRTFHKKRKWVCGSCGKVRMQKSDKTRKDEREPESEG